MRPSTVAPAGGIDVIAHGLEAGETMRLELESRQHRAVIGDYEVDPAGHVERTIALPADLGEGVYDVRLRGPDGSLVSGIVVLDAAAGPGVVVDRGISPIVAVGITILGVAVLVLALRRLGSVPKSGAATQRTGRSGHGGPGPTP